MMKRQLSEEQLDQLMQTLLNASAADEATISEIADSPSTWRGVHRRISEQKATRLFAWRPVGKMFRWLMIGAPAAAAVVLVISFFVFRQAEINDKAVVTVTPSVSKTVENPSESLKSAEYPDIVGRQPVINPTKQAKRYASTAKFQPAVRSVAVKTAESASKANRKDEIKTEFIALSYARDPESGQIVRVKVPSSMMVSLGLVTDVQQPSELVDAEVLVGDDGLTRAIRFIR